MILGESCRAAAAKLVGTLDSCIRAVSCGALAKEKALGNPGLIPVVVEAAGIEPASENHPELASTRVSRSLFWPASPTGRVHPTSSWPLISLSDRPGKSEN